MTNTVSLEIGSKVENGVEVSYGFLRLSFNATAVCGCGWRGKTHSCSFLFSYKNNAQKLALLEYFSHEKTH